MRVTVDLGDSVNVSAAEDDQDHLSIADTVLNPAEENAFNLNLEAEGGVEAAEGESDEESEKFENECPQIPALIEIIIIS